jgi:hypothetical protein
LVLKRGGRVGRSILAPELVAYAVDAHDLAGVKGEQRNETAKTGAPQWHLDGLVIQHEKGSEDSELHGRTVVRERDDSRSTAVDATVPT